MFVKLNARDLFVELPQVPFESEYCRALPVYARYHDDRRSVTFRLRSDLLRQFVA